MIREREISTVIPAVISFHHTVRISKSTASPVLDPVSPSGQRYRMIMRKSPTQRFRGPIRVNSPANIIQFIIISGIKTTIHLVI